MKFFSREEKIVEIAQGKKVMHLGCVGFTDVEISQRVALAKETLHYRLTEKADVLGVDYSNDAIEYYRREGVFENVIHGDAENLQDLDCEDVFEVIIAGDIIEHLGNPSRMLDGLRRFCDENTVLVLTTPNSFGLAGFIRYFLGSFREGEEHVMSFNEQNLSHLLKRNGFKIAQLDTCFQEHARSGRMFKVGRFMFSRFPKWGGTLFVQARLSQVLARK